MPPRKWYDPQDPFEESPIPDEVKIEGSNRPVRSSVKEPTNDEIAKAPRPTKVYDRTDWSNTNNLDYEVSKKAERSDIDAYKRVENRRQRRKRTVAPATANFTPKKKASTIARTSSAESAASSRSYTPSTSSSTSSSASSPARSKPGKVDYYKADRATRRKMEQERIAGVAKRANEWARNTRNYSNEPKSTNWSQTPEGKDRQARIRQRNLAEANRTIADENRYNTQNMDELTGAAIAGTSLLPGFLAAGKAAPVLARGARAVASTIPRLASRARGAANQAAPRVGSTPQSNPGVPITRSSSPGPTIRRPSPTPSTPTAPATRGNSPRPTIRRPASSPSTSSSTPTTRNTPTRPTLRKPTSGSTTSTAPSAPSAPAAGGNSPRPTIKSRGSTSPYASSPSPPRTSPPPIPRSRPPKPASKRGKP